MTTAAQPLLLKLLDPATRPEPYPVFRQFLTAGPLQLPESNLVVFAGFDHCDEVLRHPASCSDRLKSTIVQRSVAAGEDARPFGTP
ncbi:MAG: cytochrome P450, partial [Mycobacteriaceae bacterium]|nr:cytochrome P450 [Mycobacteriaceae bacterium]